jgi:lysophospholipase L1-like esterase
MKRFLVLFLLLAVAVHGATITCTFTAADNSTLEDYAVGGEATWTENTGASTGNILISDSNRGHTDTTNTSFYYVDNFTPATYNYDVEAQVTFLGVPTSNSVYFGVGGRATTTNTNTGYMAWLARASGVWQVQLARYGAATLTTANITTPITNDVAVLKMTMRDHIIKVYWGGVEVINYQVDHTSAHFLTSVGYPTLYMDGNTSHLTDSTGLHVDNYTVTDAAAQTLDSVNVTNSELWYNTYDGTGNPVMSPLATWKFTTAATVIKITGTSDLYGQKPGDSRLGLRINGTAYGTNLSFTADETRQFTTYHAEGVKTIEVIASTQISPDADSHVYACEIDSIICVGNDIDPDYTLISPDDANGLLIYGDSISSGYNSSPVEKIGLCATLRNVWGRNAHLEAWGSRQLYDDGVDSAARQVLVNRFALSNPRFIWLAIGTNDASFDDWDAATFGTAYADLLDKINTTIPGVKVFCQSPLLRTSETDHQDFRDQIATAAAARPSFCEYVNGAGSALLRPCDLDSDGVHLSNSGQFQFADAVRCRVWGARVTGAGSALITGAGSTLTK